MTITLERPHRGPMLEPVGGPAPRHGTTQRTAMLTLTAAFILQPILRPAGPGNSSPVDVLTVASILTAAIWATSGHQKLRAPYFIPVALIVIAGAASGLAGPIGNAASWPSGRARHGGTSARPAKSRATRARATCTKSAGQSPGWYPAPRSTWWISSSERRRVRIPRAGNVAPRLVTGASQAAAGRSAAAAANAAALARRSAASSAADRPAPAATPRARASSLGYIGISVPVRAQASRFRKPSALRAMWVRTCPRVQPGSRDPAAAWASVSPSAVASRRSVDSPSRARARAISVSTVLLCRGSGPSSPAEWHPGKEAGGGWCRPGAPGPDGTARRPQAGRRGPAVCGPGQRGPGGKLSHRGDVLSVVPNTMTCPCRRSVLPVLTWRSVIMSRRTRTPDPEN